MNCFKGKLTRVQGEKCSLCDPVLDHFFRGGLPCGSVTELTGEASAAKTQVCLQLLLTCQLPRHLGGLDGSAVYIYTEGDPALDRLRELAEMLPFRLDPIAGAAPAGNLMDRIFLETNFDDGNSLLARLQHLRGLLLRRGPGKVRALVIDSIAHLFRDLGDENPDAAAAAAAAAAAESVMHGLRERTEVLFKISALLRRYADEFNLVVLVTNQIVDAMEESKGVAAGHTGGLQLRSSGRVVVPALGLAWANCVNSRVFLSKEATGDKGVIRIVHQGPLGPAMQRAVAAGTAAPPKALPQLRLMQVVFSPVLPQSRCAYVVEQTGVRGLHPSEVHPVAATS